jgi:O-antigen ligase
MNAHHSHRFEHTIGSLPVTQINAHSVPATRSAPAWRSFSAIVGGLLFLLLAFTTATVWVRQAWAIQCFQIGIYALVIVQLIEDLRRGADQRQGAEGLARGFAPRLVYLIPLWGVFQLLAHTTTSSFETRESVLRWGALAGVFYLSQTLTRSADSRRRFLNAVLCFGAAMAILFLLEINTAQGRILWTFPTGFNEIYGTFQNKNNYVQFIEVVLPIALWGAVREGWRSWWFALAGGVLYASAIGATSRAGFLLCTAELIAIPLIALVRTRGSKPRLLLPSIVSIILMIPLVAGAFTFAVGWARVWQRFKDEDPFAIRREYLRGAVEMARRRPLTGYGLGTYEQVYQQFAVKDDPMTANHAHDDWAEFAAEGGVPFLLLVLVPFLAVVPSMIRHPWALGLLAVMLNACVDYPFPRPAVSGWMFAVLGALYMARQAAREVGQMSA